MKKSILSLILSLAAYFAFGQCGPYTVTAVDSTCTSYVLTVSGASAAQQIVWYQNGIPLDTVVRGPIGITVAGGNGFGANSNQINLPTSIFVDESDNLYVADAGNTRIQKFPAGSTSATNGVTVAQLGHSLPVSVFVDTSGNVYVVDQLHNNVQKFPAGSNDSTIGTIVAGGNGAGSAANQFNNPTTVFVDRSGNIFVADEDNNRIQKFPAGSTSATNATTVAANQLSYPTGLFVDSLGNIYVDNNSTQIIEFPSNSTSTTTGVVVGGDGYGSAPNQFNNSWGIYVDHAGDVYVADMHNDRIQEFPVGSTSATNGITVAGGSGGSAANQLFYPYDVYLDGSKNIYVADYNNNRIQKWSQPPLMGIGTSIYVTSAGTYTAIITDTLGCIRSSDTITVSANSIGSNISQGICQGAVYVFNGHSLSTAGTYFDTLASVGGCDSIVTLVLTVYPPTTSSLTADVCQGTGYTLGTHTYTTGGTHIDTLSGASIHGCDSIVTLHLTVYPLAIDTFASSTCTGQGYTFGSNTYSAPGVYTDTLPIQSIHGCDSLQTLILTFYPPADTTILQAICPGSGYMLGTNTYTTSGIYTDTLAGAAIYGCDSIVTLELVVLDSTTAYFSLQPSDTPHTWFIILPNVGNNITYTWNWGDSTISVGDTVSHTYTSAGYYNICLTVTDSAGCSATYCDTSVYLYKNQSGQMVYVQVLPQYPAGINTINTESLNINYYANAVHFLEVLQAPTQLRLYDLSGRVVMEQGDFAGSAWNIRSDIAQGIYIVQLQNANYSLTKKLMILQ